MESLSQVFTFFARPPRKKLLVFPIAVGEGFVNQFHWNAGVLGKR